MQDYSDIIYVMGAMVIFSLLTMQAHRTFVLNDQLMVQAELEYNAISVAQNHADKLKWIKTESQLNDFIDEYPTTDSSSLNVAGYATPFTVDIEVEDMALSGSTVANKKITVTVQNQFIKYNPFAPNSPLKEIKAEIMKSFQ